MIISSKIKPLTKIVGTDESLVTNCVLVDGNTAMATNGVVLAIMSDDDIGDLDLFEKEKYNEIYSTPTALKKETVEKIFKTSRTPKDGEPHKPLVLQPDIEDPNMVRVIVPGLGDEEVVLRQTKVQEEFPALEMLCEELEKGSVSHRVRMNSNQLMKVCKMIQELKTNSSEIELVFYSNRDGVLFNHITSEIMVKGILMPLRNQETDQEDESQMDMDLNDEQNENNGGDDEQE